MSVAQRNLTGMPPKYIHEGLVELFRCRPELAAGFLHEVFGLPLPDFQQTRTEACDFTDIGPKEFRGDMAFSLTNGSGTPVAGIAVEVQLRRDGTRQWSWPVYVVTLRARLKCPVFLLVVAPDVGVAEWAARPIDLGHPGMTLRPLVLGPNQVPAVTDPAEAVAVPERAVLSAIAHAEGPQAREVLSALLAGLVKTEDERAKMYYDIVHKALSESAQHHLEELMTTGYEYQSDFARKYVDEGRAEGRASEAARMVLTVLDARGISVSDEIRARVLRCADVDQLETWVRRAVLVDTADELFD
ncbi:hypothetical protein [Nocardia ninae]|uniref:hypothetical protein n=2 Tax=Nocardia ninae TaxID=356145 RepID=UPI001FE9B7A8|nr:hypothetical protein [Nocardia ninae]